MTEFANRVTELAIHPRVERADLLTQLTDLAKNTGYTVADINGAKPWGGYIRFDYGDGDRFVAEFFPGVNPLEARLGNPEAELSPKFLLVMPGERLSWQVHERRAERWAFITRGAYYKSHDPDDMGDLVIANPGDTVQFEAGECHRLVGDNTNVTLVAEIWQHTDSESLSNEEDITRLQDDYDR